ncbi:MAG: 30S ribosomal protein S3 [Endomicrobiales bacterium]|nr:30S ribosomal protein S3 [Endomicrobiales bacterium]
MGQKIHPKSVRLGYIKDWDSKWFNLKEMPDLIEEDQRIRRYLKDKLYLAAVSKIGIDRAGKYLRVNLFTARPGIVIGKGGQGIENLKTELEQITGRKAFVNVMEIKKPEIDAQLCAESIAMQLEKQISYRRAMKRVIEKAMSSGAQGIKIMVSGRLGGAEIARREWLREGRIPLQTFRADIDYGFAEAFTTMGQIGCKVWIFKKELYKKTEKELLEEAKLVEGDIKIEGPAKQDNAKEPEKKTEAAAGEEATVQKNEEQR